MVVLYRSESEHGRNVEQYAREFTRRTSRQLQLIEVDSVEGSELARLYDVTQYPAILATANDGSLENMWQGEPLPLIDEVTGYVLEQ